MYLLLILILIILRRLGGTRNFAKWWWLRRGWASQHTISNGFFDVHIMLIARRERLEMYVQVTLVLGHLQMNLICLRNHLFSTTTPLVIPQWIILLDRTPRRKLWSPCGPWSHHLLGEIRSVIWRILSPLRLQDGRGFSIVLCRGAISIRLGPRHTSMAKDVGVDVFVSPPADQPSQGNKTADEYVVSSQWKAWNSKDSFFLWFRSIAKEIWMIFRIFHLVRFFFLFFWLELTIIDRRLRRPISIPSFWWGGTSPFFAMDLPRSCRKLSRQLDYDLAFTFQEMYLG